MCKLIILFMMRLLILSNFVTSNLQKITIFLSEVIQLVNIWMESIEEYLKEDFAMSYGDGSLSDKLVSFVGMINNFFTIQNWILYSDPSLKIGGYPSHRGELKI